MASNLTQAPLPRLKLRELRRERTRTHARTHALAGTEAGAPPVEEAKQ